MAVQLEPSTPPAETRRPIHVELEGEFFAGLSFSNINEKLAQKLSDSVSVALSLRRVHRDSASFCDVPSAHPLAALFGRTLPRAPDVTIRHAFPPKFEPPPSGTWAHIQPWEFGLLPRGWATLLAPCDEVWAYSQYVRRVYEASGFPAEKIHVIPLGVDPEVFHPQADRLPLPTRKSFAFLYVGGAIFRKGFDRLLEAYLAEFNPGDDVVLVVKDVGAGSFYSMFSRQEILAARDDPAKPEIIYINDELPEADVAGLYTACNCLVAPYRGEGFCLPVLEAMACGIPAIVPRHGPTDDFVTERTAFLLDSRVSPCRHHWRKYTCRPQLWTFDGVPTEISIDRNELRRVMRRAYEDRDGTQHRGGAAAEHIDGRLTWDRTAEAIRHRLEALACRPERS